MRHAAFYSTLVLLLTLASCSDPTGVDRAEGVVFSAARSHVVLENNRVEPIGYAVMDAALAARSLVGACAGVDCPTIAPGEGKRIEKHEISGAGESDQVIAFWWPLVRTSTGELRPDSIRGLRITY